MSSEQLKKDLAEALNALKPFGALAIHSKHMKGFIYAVTSCDIDRRDEITWNQVRHAKSILKKHGVEL